MAELHVELVSADSRVWQGEASMVLARTTDGDLGVLPGHTPLLGVLVEGEVSITASGGQGVTAAVDGGFLSVENDRVLVVAESVSVTDGAPSTR